MLSNSFYRNGKTTSRIVLLITSAVFHVRILYVFDSNTYEYRVLIFVRIFVRIFAYVSVRIQVHILIRIFARIQQYCGLYIHVYIHVYTFIYRRIYVSIWTYWRSFLNVFWFISECICNVYACTFDHFCTYCSTYLQVSLIISVRISFRIWTYLCSYLQVSILVSQASFGISNLIFARPQIGPYEIHPLPPPPWCPILGLAYCLPAPSLYAAGFFADSAPSPCAPPSSSGVDSVSEPMAP